MKLFFSIIALIHLSASMELPTHQLIEIVAPLSIDRPVQSSHSSTNATNRSIPCRACAKLFYTYAQADRHYQALHKDNGPTGTALLLRATSLLTSASLRDFPDVPATTSESDKDKENEEYSPTLTTKKKIFICIHCFKQFSSEQRFLIHTETHSTEKPFACPQCTKRFKRKDSLRVHALLHGPATFKCPECRARYKQKVGLRYHIKKEHASFL